MCAYQVFQFYIVRLEPGLHEQRTHLPLFQFYIVRLEPQQRRQGFRGAGVSILYSAIRTNLRGHP